MKSTIVKQSEWFDLSEAAVYLGVHFTTLRRWADSGEIEHIRTPGGKRRFSQAALDEFISQHMHTLAVSNPLPALEKNVIQKTHDLLPPNPESGEAWMVRMSQEQRADLHNTGNRLIALIMQYSSREDGTVFLEEGKKIARGYGEFCFQSGINTGDCLRIFLMFRRPILDSIHETDALNGMSDKEGRLLYERATTFLDELLVTMIAHYSELSSPT